MFSIQFIEGTDLFLDENSNLILQDLVKWEYVEIDKKYNHSLNKKG